MIRWEIPTCTEKPTESSLVYRTVAENKNSKRKKLETKNRKTELFNKLYVYRWYLDMAYMAWVWGVTVCYVDNTGSGFTSQLVNHEQHRIRPTTWRKLQGSR